VGVQRDKKSENGTSFAGCRLERKVGETDLVTRGLSPNASLLTEDGSLGDFAGAEQVGINVCWTVDGQL
jgi:hypothetical protein